ELVKVDTDANQMLAGAFGIRGIPAVKAFRDGQVVDEFTGAIPPAEIERFLDRLLPSPADDLAETGDEASLRRALALDPRHATAPASGVGPVAAFGAGFVSFLSPCVLPLVPGYISAVTGVQLTDLDRADWRRVLVPSLLFVGSFSAIFIALGLASTGLGHALQ